MTLDRERIAQRLEVLERLLADWEQAAPRTSLDALQRDRRTCLFLCYVMGSAIQTSLDLSSHLIADLGFSRPSSYRESFAILGRARWLSRPLARQLEELAGLRNILVHHYPDLDYAKLLPHVRGSWRPLRSFARSVARKALRRLGPKA